MYIRYFPAGSVNCADVRDVHHFHIEQMESGASIVDALAKRSAYFGNDIVKSLASYLLGGEDKAFSACRERNDVYAIDLQFTPFPEELAVFDSVEAAAKVLDEICRSLDSGKQYFDLTRYGNDGNLL